MITLAKTFITHFTYLALVLVLVAAGLGVPIPEDIPLAFSGYLCHEDASPIAQLDNNGDGQPDKQRHVPHVYLMIIAGMVGVLAGDTIVFYVGRHGIDSDNFVARHLRKVMHSKRRAKAERHFHKHGTLTVFLGRFMPGLRSLVFAMAGMSKMSYPRFLVIDGIAALISVPTFVLLGYYFAHDFNKFIARVDRLKHFLLLAGAVVLLGVLCLYIVRRRRTKPAPALEQTEAVR